MSPLPIIDTPPVDPDQWQTRGAASGTYKYGGAYGGVYHDTWPFGRSATAKAAAPRASTAGTSTARTTSRPAYMTLDSDGAYRLPDDFVIYGNVDWQGVKVRARRLVIANTWYDATIAGHAGRTLADTPPFYELDPTSGTVILSSCQLDLEDVLFLGTGNAAAADTARSFRVDVGGTPSSGATMRLTVGYTKDDGTAATVQTAAISAPFNLTKVNAALAALTFTGVAGSPKVLAFGPAGPNQFYFIDAANIPFVSIAVSSVTGTGYTPTVIGGASRMNDTRQVSVGSCTNLARLPADPKGSYPSGLQEWCSRFRMGDLFKGAPGDPLTLWHGTDAGLHAEREAVFASLGVDLWSFLSGGNPTSHLPILRFVLATVSGSGLFANHNGNPATDGSSSIAYALAAQCLLRGRSSQAKLFYITRKPAAGSVTDTGAVDCYADSNARDPVTEAVRSPAAAPRYLQVEADNPEVTWDTVKTAPAGAALSVAAAIAGSTPSTWSGTAKTRPASLLLPAPIDPDAAPPTGGLPAPAPAGLWNQAVARYALTAAAVSAAQYPNYTNPSAGGVTVPGTGDTPPPPTSLFLHAVGTQLKDSTGADIQLNGENLATGAFGNLIDPASSSGTTRDDVIAMLLQSGVNHVRLSVGWRDFETQPPVRIASGADAGRLSHQWHVAGTQDPHPTNTQSQRIDRVLDNVQALRDADPDRPIRVILMMYKNVGEWFAGQGSGTTPNWLYPASWGPADYNNATNEALAKRRFYRNEHWSSPSVPEMTALGNQPNTAEFGRQRNTPYGPQALWTELHCEFARRAKTRGLDNLIAFDVQNEPGPQRTNNNTDRTEINGYIDWCKYTMERLYWIEPRLGVVYEAGLNTRPTTDLVFTNQSDMITATTPLANKVDGQSWIMFSGHVYFTSHDQTGSTPVGSLSAMWNVGVRLRGPGSSSWIPLAEAAGIPFWLGEWSAWEEDRNETSNQFYHDASNPTGRTARSFMEVEWDGNGESFIAFVKRKKLNLCHWSFMPGTAHSSVFPTNTSQFSAQNPSKTKDQVKGLLKTAATANAPIDEWRKALYA